MWRDGLLENREQRRRLAQTQNRLAAPPPSAPPAPLAPSLQADAGAGEKGAAGEQEIAKESMGASAMSDALSRCHDLLEEGSSAAAAPCRSAGGLSAWYNEISTDNFGYASAALGFGGGNHPSSMQLQPMMSTDGLSLLHSHADLVDSLQPQPHAELTNALLASAPPPSARLAAAHATFGQLSPAWHGGARQHLRQVAASGGRGARCLRLVTVARGVTVAGVGLVAPAARLAERAAPGGGGVAAVSAAAADRELEAAAAAAKEEEELRGCRHRRRSPGRCGGRGR